ncbi:MAG: hypothetical protein EOO40_12960 [Deltaproteobacteria bacterium]|nr:MAG: hypothetical protein EOO40_12960 [Deltaproteobacteria bacterium]
MAEDNNFRIEARLTGATRGISPTTEQIQVLLERREAHARLTRKTPETPFDAVLEARQDSSGDREGNADEPAADATDAEAEAGPSSAPSTAPARGMSREAAGHAGGMRPAMPPPTVRGPVQATRSAQVPAAAVGPTRPVPTGAPQGTAGSPHLQGGRRRKFIVRG